MKFKKPFKTRSKPSKHHSLDHQNTHRDHQNQPWSRFPVEKIMEKISAVQPPGYNTHITRRLMQSQLIFKRNPCDKSNYRILGRENKG